MMNIKEKLNALSRKAKATLAVILVVIAGLAGTTAVSPDTFGGRTSTTGGAVTTLSDVTITSATDKDILQYNGTRWVNRTPALAQDLMSTSSDNFVGTGFSIVSGLTADDDWEFKVRDIDGATNQTVMKCDSFNSPTCTWGFSVGAGTINMRGAFNGYSAGSPQTGLSLISATTTIGDATDGNIFTPLIIDGGAGNPATTGAVCSAALRGAMYWDDTNHRLWICKSSGVWFSVLLT